MKLDIVIPTLNRRDKLQVCLNSVFKSAKRDTINLSVYFGNQDDLDFFNLCLVGIPNVSLKFLEEYRVPTFWNSYLYDMKADGLCYLNDDVELFDDTLEVAIEEFERRFPDYDGVMGFNQVNLLCLNKVESAFGIIGKKYAERFPYQQVFCPDYYRFYGDYELWQYAKSINKFYFCEEAKLNHYHPALSKRWEDETHRIVRKWLSKDRETFQKRQQQKLLWGSSYRLITEE